MLPGLRQNPKTREQREKNLRQNRDRNEKVGKEEVSSRASESRGRGEIERALRRCDGGGSGDGEIQKVDHGPSKLKLSCGGRERKKEEMKLEGKLRNLLILFFNLKI